MTSSSFQSKNLYSENYTIPMFIVCRSEAIAETWRARSTQLYGFSVIAEIGCKSYYEVINRIISAGYDRPVLLCHDDIQCGLGFIDAIFELVDELSCNHRCWGVCGNAGVSWDGFQIFRYLKDPHGGPSHGLGTNHVLGVDGNLMLLNVPQLASAGVVVPDLGGFHGYDIVLSLECLRKGLSVLCDRRLFVTHYSGGDQKSFNDFANSSIFQKYMFGRFVNNVLPTINGIVEVFELDDKAEVSTTVKDDVITLFDTSIVVDRIKRPTVTIGCRSQLNRPELLARAVDSFACSAQQAPEMLDIVVRIISDQPEELLTREIDRLRLIFPQLNLDGWFVPSSSTRFSRTEALLFAVQCAETDYIWFVDDDDFIFSDAIRPVARALIPGGARLVIGHSQRLEEVWALHNDERRLCSSCFVGRNMAQDVFKAFLGDNFTPICSVIFPVNLLRDRLRGMKALGDYYEDYFLILILLSSSRVEVFFVFMDLCGISLRNGENTVNVLDRSVWELSYATFMSEILRHPDATSPLLWQLADWRNGAVFGPSSYGMRVDSNWKRCSLKKILDLTLRFAACCRYRGVRYSIYKAWRYIFRN